MGTREETTAVEWAFSHVQIFFAFQFPTKLTVTYFESEKNTTITQTENTT